MNPDRKHPLEDHAALTSRDGQAYPHPSQEELDDLLMGIATIEVRTRVEAHLELCPSCLAQVTTVQSALSVFNQASLAWSEARSNSLPLPSAAPAVSSWRGLPGRLVVAAIVLFALALGLHLFHRPAPAPLTAANRAPAVSNQELARDNDLLQAINAEINTPVPSPAELYSDAPTPKTRQERD